MKRNMLKIVIASTAAALVLIGLMDEGDPPSMPRIEKKYGHDNPITRHGALVWGPHGVVHDLAYYEVTGKAYRTGMVLP